MERTMVLAMMLGSGMMIAGACVPCAAMQQETEGNVSTPKFSTGGIGDDDPMLQTKGQYNLHLVFSTKGSGEYLADVSVSIKNRSGIKVLETLSTGPLFYVQLPPGNYRISAEFMGTPISKSVSLPRIGSRNLYFYW